MYFHISEGIYLSYFNNELIALDIEKDKYHILPEELSLKTEYALSNEFEKDGDKYVLLNRHNTAIPDNFNESVHDLIDLRILSWNNHNQPNEKVLLKSACSAGAANIDWHMSRNDLFSKTNKVIILEAYISLVKVFVLMHLYGFRGLIDAIRKNADKTCNLVKPEEFNVLVSALNKACFFFPVRTKCLEWSGALILLGLKKKLKCNLEIGVQNLPFAAHAWVRVGDKVIADTQDLPNTLSVILSEPFN